MRRSYCVRITTLGDLLLDVDRAARRRRSCPATTSRRHDGTGAGGQAANVAAWAAALGADARSSASVGADAAGELVAARAGGARRRVVGPVAGRTGVVVSLAAAGDRTMASDRGAAPELAAHELDPAWFDCDVLHVSGYSLLREPIASAAAARGRGPRAHTARGSRSTCRPGRSSTTRSARASRALAPDLVFATEREREAVGELDDALGR